MASHKKLFTATVLKAAGYSINPVFSLFEFDGKGRPSLLGTYKTAEAVVDAFYAAAANGSLSLEIRCDGRRVTLPQ